MSSSQKVQPARELTRAHLERSRILPNRHHILHELPKGGVVAEIGVAFGDFSHAILTIVKPRAFYAIDLYDLEKYETAFGIDLRAKFGGKTHEQFVRDRFSMEIADGRFIPKRGSSVEMMGEFDDESFDFIYIDASHEYTRVKKDLEICKRKIKPEGVLVLNDYTMCNPNNAQQYGVIQATHEFCLDEGWEITRLALHPTMFCDVVLRKIEPAARPD